MNALYNLYVIFRDTISKICLIILLVSEKGNVSISFSKTQVHTYSAVAYTAKEYENEKAGTVVYFCINLKYPALAG